MREDGNNRGRLEGQNGEYNSQQLREMMAGHNNAVFLNNSQYNPGLHHTAVQRSEITFPQSNELTIERNVEEAEEKQQETSEVTRSQQIRHFQNARFFPATTNGDDRQDQIRHVNNRNINIDQVSAIPSSLRVYENEARNAHRDARDTNINLSEYQQLTQTLDSGNNAEQIPDTDAIPEEAFNTVLQARQGTTSAWPALETVLNNIDANQHTRAIANILVLQYITLEANPERIEFSVIKLLADIANFTTQEEKIEISNQLFDPNIGVFREANLDGTLRGINIGNIKNIFETIFSDSSFLNGSINIFQNCLAYFENDSNKLMHAYNIFTAENVENNILQFVLDTNDKYMENLESNERNRGRDQQRNPRDSNEHQQMINSFQAHIDNSNNNNLER